MSKHLKLNHRILSISTAAALTAVGVLSSITLPAVAQRSGEYEYDFAQNQPPGQNPEEINVPRLPREDVDCPTPRGVEGEPIEEADVPPPVLQAAQEIAGDVQFERVNSEQEEGATIYELSATLPSACAFEVDVVFEPDSGEVAGIEEIEQQLPIERTRQLVPPQARETLDQFVRGFQPELLEQSERPLAGDVSADVDTFFEFDGTRRGENLEVQVRADGSVIRIDREPAQP